MVPDHRTAVRTTTWFRPGLSDFLLRLIAATHRISSYTALTAYSRHATGLAGIVLLGAVVLSTAARRPYLRQVAPGIRASKAAAVVLTSPDVAPITPLAQIPTPIVTPPSNFTPFQLSQKTPLQLQRTFCVRVLRSPPAV